MDIWEMILEGVKVRVGENIFKLWFEGSKLLRTNGEEIVIEFDSLKKAEWVADKYYNVINEVAHSIKGDNALFVFCAKDNQGREELIVPGIRNVNIKNRTKKSFLGEDRFLEERYTFENFVVADFNRIAHAAAYSVAKKPGNQMYNPLFIYGGNGVGKTHLLQAIANYTRKHLPSLNVMYATAERFKEDYTLSLKRQKLDEFRRAYREVDMLLLDDVQLMENWSSTQEELFHIYNSLYMRGKQIVLTSDCPPKEMVGIDKRLISRFNSGLVIEITTPGLEAKILILKRKAEKHNLHIPDDVLEFIAANTDGDIRELENCLKNLYVNLFINGKPINIASAREVLHYLEKNKQSDITSEKIIQRVAEAFNVTTKEIMSRKRTKEIALARQVAMYLVREILDYSLNYIGKIFNGKNHATVIHACEIVKNLMQTDEDFREKVNTIKDSFYRKR